MSTQLGDFVDFVILLIWILTQLFLPVVIVLIFAELAPMFAARRYAENVAMLGIGPRIVWVPVIN